jgi:acetyl-CoA synthetase
VSELYPVPERVRTGSTSPIPTREAYLEEAARATHDPSGYWLARARQHLVWMEPPTVGLVGDYRTVKEKPFTWFHDGVLNVTVSCLDRHLAERGDKVALLWEGDEPGHTRTLTYREVHREVCRVAHVLAQLGVRKGDRVIIYMGMVPETAVAMLACARVGAVHSVVFGGFSAESLRDRIVDSGARVVITQDEGRRGGRPIPLKKLTDEAIDMLPAGSQVDKVLVYRHTEAEVGIQPGRDVWWQDLVPGAPDHFDPVPTGAEDPLFVLYTSGSTGKPKGLLHTTAGYLLWACWTTAVTFDLREDDLFACMADVGWVTGHSYIVYGPLANGATSLMFESIPTYPDAGRYWEVVQRHRVTVLYTAPTALRALAAHGAAPVQRYDRSSLRVLGTVGEPINPDTWRWYHDVVGEGRCTVVDTWWQTETGGHLITPIAPITPTKPGSATLPLPGVMPVLLDEQGQTLIGPGSGRLCLAYPWPGQARTVWGDHARYVDTYFSMYPGYYFTGDGARRDVDGYWWITGRVDDVINVSGHRMGTAEFESALVNSSEVAEAAVVGYPHDLKGQGVWAYVVLQPAHQPDDGLSARLNALCRTSIGAHARVDIFQFVPGLPKTRSGKVMRRILRKVAEGDASQLGDISTLADPSVVAAIVEGAAKVRA